MLLTRLRSQAYWNRLAECHVLRRVWGLDRDDDVVLSPTVSRAALVMKAAPHHISGLTVTLRPLAMNPPLVTLAETTSVPDQVMERRPLLVLCTMPWPMTLFLKMWPFSDEAANSAPSAFTVVVLWSCTRIGGAPTDARRASCCCTDVSDVCEAVDESGWKEAGDGR